MEVRNREGAKSPQARGKDENNMSPMRNRFSPLADSIGFWEAPSLEVNMGKDMAGKRQRETSSPQGKKSPKRASRRNRIPEEELMDMEECSSENQEINSQGNEEEEERKIETVISVRNRWDEKEKTGEMHHQTGKPIEAGAREKNDQESDMKGVKEEMEAYKRSLKDDKKSREKEYTGEETAKEIEIEDSIVSQHLYGCKCGNCPRSTNKKDRGRGEENKSRNKKEDRSKEQKQEISHNYKCNCEKCMYAEVRELTYKTKRNISLVLDEFMGRPPIKDTHKHPKSCLCGTHLRTKIKGERIPYDDIIQQIVDNNFHP